MNEDLKIVEVPFTNIYESIINKSIVSKSLLSTLQALPRIPIRAIPRKKRVKTPWSLEKSIFKDYISDNEKILSACFDKDWENGKIPKLIKKPEEALKVKEILKKNYKTIKEAYKYYSALEPSNGIFSIGLNVYTDMVTQTGALDPINFSINDMDLEFVSTNASKIKSQFNPERSLIRHQMTEILTRIALKKFLYSGIVKTPSAALSKFMAEYFLPTYQYLDADHWRKTYLYKEECDTIIKKYLVIINSVFSKYGLSLPGKPKCITVTEFTAIATDANIVDEGFGARELGPIFNLSMMTTTDELTNPKFYQMNLIEFIEALCRVADKLAIASPYSGSSVSKDNSKNQPLNLKIKAFLELLLFRVVNPSEKYAIEKQLGFAKNKYRKQYISTTKLNTPMGLEGSPI